MNRFSLLPAVFLVLIGILQMAGDVFNFPLVKAIGLASVASPAPKVFTSQNGFETYANRFFIKYTDIHNQLISKQITPSVYSGLQGPYNRRNMYGAATAYAPVLATNPQTQPMLDSVMQYAFCGDTNILREFAISNHQPHKPVSIRLEPIGANKGDSQWPLELQVLCDE